MNDRKKWMVTKTTCFNCKKALLEIIPQKKKTINTQFNSKPKLEIKIHSIKILNERK